MNPKTSIGRKAQVKSGTVYMLSLFMVMGLVFASASLAETKSVPTDVIIGKAVILNVPVDIKTVSITDPEVADIVVINQREVQINGKAIGSTNMIIWDRSGGRTFFDVNVVVDFGSLKDKILDVAPGDDVKLQMISKDTLLVTGTVTSDERRLKIHNLLLGFGKDITETELYVLQGGVTKEVRATGGGEGKGFKFVMLLEVTSTPQVMLQITVASIDRTATRNLGINWAYAGRDIIIDTAVSSVTGGLTDLLGLSSGGGQWSLDTHNISGASFGIAHSPSGTQYMLKALASKGLAKILAEPNLIVRSGEKGAFLAGGEVPIPTLTSISGSGGGNTVTVTYKEFGVKLNFAPVVTESGLIRLAIDPAEVSTVTSSLTTVSGFSLPTFLTDRVSTSVDLREGESFVVAGLINNEWSKNLTKIPIIGDIPIIGAFFRDQSLNKTEKELIFVITPKTVKPMAPGVKTELPGASEPNAGQTNDLRWMPLMPTKKSLDPENIR